MRPDLIPSENVVNNFTTMFECKKMFIEIWNVFARTEGEILNISYHNKGILKMYSDALKFTLRCIIVLSKLLIFNDFLNICTSLSSP